MKQQASGVDANGLRSTADDGEVLYVTVYDSAEPPEVFESSEAETRQWADKNRPGWKVDGESIRDRWLARITYTKLVEEAREEGWYQPGPTPDPCPADCLDRPHRSVTVVHHGLVCFVYADQSDAEASNFLANLSPLASACYTLHAVRVTR